MFKKTVSLLITISFMVAASINIGLYAGVEAATGDPVLVSRDGSGPLDQGGSNFYTSDDGNTVAFSAAREVSGGYVHEIQIRNVQTQTNQVVTLGTTGISTDGDLEGMSGDGRHVYAAVRSSDTLQAGLYVYNVDDGTNVRVPDPAYDGNAVTASYNGSKLVYNQVDESGVESIYTYSAISGSIALLISNASISSDQLSSDGTVLAYTDYSNPDYSEVRLYNFTSGSSTSILSQTDSYASTAFAVKGGARYVYFRSLDPTLTSETPSECEYRLCYYRQDTTTGTIKLVLPYEDGQIDNVDSYQIGISSDGTKIIAVNSSNTPGITIYNVDNNQKYDAGYAAGGVTPARGAFQASLTNDGITDSVIFSTVATDFGSYKTCKDENNAPEQCINIFKETVSSPPASSDTTPPVVTGSPARAANAANWYKAPVTITWSATDPDPSSGTPTIPAPTVANLQGTHAYTSAPSCDPAGNCATGSFTVSLDSVVPGGAFTGSAAVISLLGQTITGTATDDDSGVVAVSVKEGNTTLSTANGGVILTCNGAKTSCTWKTVASKQRPYIGNVTVTVTDKADNTHAASKFYTIL